MPEPPFFPARGDELVVPAELNQVEESEARTNAGTGGSAVASGAPGDVDKIRQPASLQVSK